MGLCKCGQGGKNTGRPNCIPKRDYVYTLIMVKYINDSGAINFIDCETDVVVDVSAKINEADKSQRWFPLAEIVAATPERADSIFETIDDKNFKVKKGPRTFLGQFIGGAASPTYLIPLESFECGQWGYFEVDQEGNLIGEEVEPGKLYPILIQEATFDTKYIDPTSAAIEKNQISFTVDTKVKDSRFSFLTAEDTDEDLLEVNGLLDVELQATFTPTTVTELEVQANYIYGTACDKLPFSAGADGASWQIFNTDTSLNVTIDGVTVIDAEAGIYQLDYSSGVTAADVLEVSVDLEGVESDVLTLTAS